MLPSFIPGQNTEKIPDFRLSRMEKVTTSERLLPSPAFKRLGDYIGTFA